MFKFQENWNIPYKREELLGVCLEASTKLAREGTLEQNEAARKFLERILPEALKKLLTSNAIYRWASEIQVKSIKSFSVILLEIFFSILKGGGGVNATIS